MRKQTFSFSFPWKKIPILLLFFLVFRGYAISWTGQVIDAATRQGLPFVNIVFNQQGQGTTTNIDGFFSIETEQIEFLRFSYIGYEPFVVLPDQLPDNHVFILKTQPVNLNEVRVLPGENPAHRIIKKVVENRDKNNPQKWDSYQYNSYNKLAFTILDDKGLLTNLPDSITTKRDSALFKMKNLVDRQHLFLIETASQKSFVKPEKEKEVILASRVSGVENPAFFSLATQLQSFTFYNDYVSLLERDFLSPVSPNSWNKYLFELSDTLLTSSNDTLYTIRFRPRKGKYFWGLKGVMTIHTNGYAIQSVRAEDANKPTDLLRIKIEQMSELLPEGRWFPKELNAEIIYNKFNISPVPGVSFLLKGSGKTYLFNARVNPPLERSDLAGAELEVSPEFARRDTAYWNQYRYGPADPKDETTYQVIDSIGKIAHLDQRVKMMLALFEQRLPVGQFNIRLRHLLAYNIFEGVQAGFGLETNEKFSKHWQLGGYWRYGFNDGRPKYGADLSFRIRRKSETRLHFDYHKDRQEIGELFFLEQPRVFSSEDFRKLLYTEMFSVQSIGAAFEHRWANFLKTQLFVNQTDYFEPLDLIPAYTPEGRFQLRRVGLKMRLSFGEKFFDNGRRFMSLGSRYPIIFLNFEQGFDHSGFTDYYSFEFKLRDSFRLRNAGTSHVTVLGAFRNETGYGNLFVSPPAASPKFVSIYAENSFSTMPMNEFFANRMAALFWQHDLETLLFKTKNFKPFVSLAMNACWGDTNQRHPGFHSFEKGYYEGGILIRRLLKQQVVALGVGGFYRFGPYHTGDLGDDLAVKFTFDIVL